MMMNIPMNVDVYCSDGLGGRSSQVIVNPTNNQVTHLVVKEKQSPHTEYMAPIDQVVDSTPDMIKLRCTLAELATMEPFIQIDTIQNDVQSMGYPTESFGLAGNPAMGYAAYPYDPGERFMVTVKTEAVPEGEVALTSGAHIHTSNGRQVGQLDGLLADTSTGQITHLVLREGHLWGKKDVTIPIAQIDHMVEDNVYLKLDKQSISALPTTPVHS
jgi:sporulation protein YlmC with PRC-barrel domain